MGGNHTKAIGQGLEVQRRDSDIDSGIDIDSDILCDISKRLKKFRVKN